MILVSAPVHLGPIGFLNWVWVWGWGQGLTIYKRSLFFEVMNPKRALIRSETGLAC